MIFPNVLPNIIDLSAKLFNNQKGQVTFWSGTMPTQEQLIQAQPTHLGSYTRTAYVPGALESLGCVQLHQVNFSKIAVKGSNTTLVFDLPASPSNDTHLAAGSADFATFNVNSNDTHWSSSNSLGSLFYMGSVGVIGSGADLEITGVDFDSLSKVRLGTIQSTLA